MPHDINVWRSRLGHSKRVWMEKGIIGAGGMSNMRVLIEFYRSNQWRALENWGEIPQDELRVVNKVFPFANQQQASMISRNPATSYIARTQEWETSAPIVEELHNYDIREQNHKRQFAAAFRDKQFAPFGVIRHGYTPGDELDVPGRERVHADHAHAELLLHVRGRAVQQMKRRRLGSVAAAEFVELVPTQAPGPPPASWLLDVALPNGVRLRFPE